MNSAEHTRQGIRHGINTLIPGTYPEPSGIQKENEMSAEEPFEIILNEEGPPKRFWEVTAAYWFRKGYAAGLKAGK